MPDARWWGTRLIADTPSPKDKRSEFERDRSRILHSRAFRRLQAKTQVFPPSKKDFYRTRLTHSLECAQIGRALALNLWPGALESGGVDLVEAACLAHDLGHPPSGHQGEAAIRKWIPYDGNAQTLRILTLIEEKEIDGTILECGINPTLALVVSIIKYPFHWTKEAKSKYLYDDDVIRLELQTRLRNTAFTLVVSRSPMPPRPLPLLLMEWADDVAYSTHDVEDGINAGFIGSTHLRDDDVRRPVAARVAENTGLDAESAWTTVVNLSEALASELGPGADPPASRVKSVMDHRIGRLISSVSLAPGSDRDDWLYSHILDVPRATRIECEFLKATARECVFRDPRVTRLEYKQKRMIDMLFEAFLLDARQKDQKLFPRSWWPTVEAAKLEDENLATSGELTDLDSESALTRVVADYISGMSDAFCAQTFSTLFESEAGSAFVTV